MPEVDGADQLTHGGDDQQEYPGLRAGPGPGLENGPTDLVDVGAVPYRS